MVNSNALNETTIIITLPRIELVNRYNKLFKLWTVCEPVQNNE